MCTRVFIDDKEYKTPRELSVVIGAENIVWDGQFAGNLDPNADHCLCPVDCAATAKKAGYIAEYDDWNDAIWRKATP